MSCHVSFRNLVELHVDANGARMIGSLPPSTFDNLLQLKVLEIPSSLLAHQDQILNLGRLPALRCLLLHPPTLQPVLVGEGWEHLKPLVALEQLMTD